MEMLKELRNGKRNKKKLNENERWRNLFIDLIVGISVFII